MRRTSLFYWFNLFALMCFGFSARAQNINVSFLSQHEPPNSNIAFGDVWAEGNIACLGIWTGYNTSYGVGIYDISNPSAPILRSIYSTPISSHNQFEHGAVRNKIGYFGSWSSGGLHIVSLTNAASPVFLAQIGSAGNGFNDIHTLFLERDFIYEASHRTGANGPIVKVIDVSNPHAPVFVRNIVTTNTSRVHQITAVKVGAKTILYTSGWGNGTAGSPGQTDIWDVTNIGTQPAQWLGKIMSGGSSHSSWPTPDGNTLIVCRETTGGDVRFYDISNPANPVLQSIISPTTMGLPAAIPHNPVVIDNLLYLSWYQNGIQIFDITDRSKPVRIGSYDTYPSTSTASFVGNWGVFPDLGLNKLLLSDIQTGLYLLDASDVLTATNNYPLLLVAQPISVTTTQGMAATLSAEVTGSSPKYQWRFNNVAIPGATNSSLIYTNVHPTNSGNYFVIATNSHGAVTSSIASLSVVVPQEFLPTITAHPEPKSVYPESEVVFSVAVSGTAPFRYQWRFNGGNISGATNSSLTISDVQSEHVGNYSVAVTNDFGSVVSSNAALALIDSPYLNTIKATPGARSALISWNSTIPSDSLVQFSVANSVIENPASVAAMSASFNSSSYIDRKITTNHTILLTGLAPATRYSFQVISSAETNSYVSGVYQFTTAGGPIILDNTNSAVTFVGTWTSSKNVSGYYGTNYLWASTSATPLHTATFTPEISIPGKYDVSVWHTAGSDRSTGAPFTVSYQGGSNTFFLNQRINGGQWNLIATDVPFAAGVSGFIRLANNASPSVVIADAVQLTYAESQDFSTNNSIPAWWEDFYFDASIDPMDDPDGDGYSTAEEYILGTSPVDSASHLQLDLQAVGGTANITFWPYLGNRNYQLLYKASIDDASWQVLSPGTISSTQYGHGIFSLTENASHGFYRLVVQPAEEGTFSGSINLGKGIVSSGFSEAACGINRIYVTPLQR